MARVIKGHKIQLKLNFMTEKENVAKKGHEISGKRNRLMAPLVLGKQIATIRCHSHNSCLTMQILQRKTFRLKFC